jgi:hypothetical protein
MTGALTKIKIKKKESENARGGVEEKSNKVHMRQVAPEEKSEEGKNGK